MDERFVNYYRDELLFIREMASEFAEAYPKIAGRLGLERTGKEECPDPFVERLLEGFAFLSARVQLKFDSEFPRVAQSLLDTVCPGYLAPIPAMGIAEIRPDFEDGGLADGFQVPRGTELRGHKGRDEQTACTFTTGHPVTLWPLKITNARYYTKDTGLLNLKGSLNAEAALAITLECTVDVPFNELPIDDLVFHIRGAGDQPARLLEQFFCRLSMVGARVTDEHQTLRIGADGDCVGRVGLTPDEALLPPQNRGFEGYRLLREYFAFHERYHFFRLRQLRSLFSHIEGPRAQIIFIFNTAEPVLEGRIDADTFVLYATPVINLFRKRADRVQITDRMPEYPVVIDRTRSLDYEVYALRSVTGHGDESGAKLEFGPFYLSRDSMPRGRAFYSQRRAPRLLTARERAYGAISDYLGSELYLSLVDSQSAPVPREIRELSVQALCTNRHLPIRFTTGQTAGDFVPMEGPVESVHMITGPTVPVASHLHGELSWRLISHLTLNYFSITDSSEEEGAEALRGLLRLYLQRNSPELAKQVQGVRRVSAAPITRRLPVEGPITFGRGLGITVRFDENVFEGAGIFVLGSVLEQFFQKYVSINSFTETTIVSEQRGEIIKWPLATGKKHLL